jgi:hypothetical protein
MRIDASIIGDIAQVMRDEFEKGEKAVTGVMKAVATELKGDWRAQVRGAGLGNRLANAVRAKHYPQGADSMNAAALIWSNAPKITAAFEEGPTIRSGNGFWLAIPTDAAGRGMRGKKITPGEWEQRTGGRLRFVYRTGRTALLVADDARLNSRGVAAQKRGKRRADGILTGAQTVVIFTLVRQVKLPKRLDLAKSAERVGATIPGRITANWKD